MTFSKRSKLSPDSPRSEERIDRLCHVYDYAEEQGYGVYWWTMRSDAESFSVMDDDGFCYIAIDLEKCTSIPDEYCKLLHEIGHCDTGAFYNQHAVCDIRQKAENRADRRAIQLTISAEDLDEAVAAGYTTTYELAEYFGVTIDFMKKAICLHTHGNMATELYF